MKDVKSHVRTLAVYKGKESNYSTFYVEDNKDKSFEDLKKAFIEYHFYLPEFRINRIYRVNRKKMTKAAKILESASIGDEFNIDCNVNVSSSEHWVSNSKGKFLYCNPVISRLNKLEEV